jgi:hypothetical protein
MHHEDHRFMKIQLRHFFFALTLLSTLALTACKTTEMDQAEPMQKDAPMPADGSSSPQPSTPTDSAGAPQTSEQTSSGTP